VATGAEIEELDPAEIAAFQARHRAVLERIGAAARRAGRDPAEIRLVAVSKTVPAERLRAAVAAGLTVLGENRVQEGEAKRPLVPGATWELIGPLQSNKVRRAIETYDVVQSVDSADLAGRLDRLIQESGGSRVRLPVLLQVNVDDDPAKAGFAPADLEAGLGAILDLPRLRVDGLMTVGRFVDDAEAARPTFRRLRALGERLRSADGRLGPALSMGMSADFEVAIEEGATVVRVGRTLFGERPPVAAERP
jgi:pyridoxal phosphate enzyme (YggS family)